MAHRRTPPMVSSELPKPGKVDAGWTEMSTEKFYKLPVEIAARKDLPSGAKVIWAVLSDRIGNNDSCWPGVRTIAGDTGQDVSAVLRATKKLASSG